MLIQVVATLVCGRLGLWPFRFVAFRFGAIWVCDRFGLWLFWYVAVSVCGYLGLKPFLVFGRFGFCRFGLWPLWSETGHVLWLAWYSVIYLSPMSCWCIEASQQTWRNWTRCRQTTRLLQFRWVKFARCGNDVNVTKYVCDYKRQAYISNETSYKLLSR